MIWQLQGVFLVIGIVCAGDGWAKCESKGSLDDFDLVLDEAEEAYGRQLRDALGEAADRARAALACLEHLITPPRAARLHVVVAMERWAEGDHNQARLSLIAARASETEFVITETVPADDPLREAWERTRRIKVARAKLDRPASGTFRFDGLQAMDRPAEIPTVYQRLDSVGRPTQGRYIWPDEELPPYTPYKKVKTPKRFLK